MTDSSNSIFQLFPSGGPHMRLSLQRSTRRTVSWPVDYALLACLPLLLAIPAQTQVYAGSITGLVQDPSGAVVPNASVILTDADKGVQYSAVTDSTGRYLLRALPPSTYNIRI